MFTLAHLSDIHLAPLPSPRLDQLMSKRILGYLNWQRRRLLHQRELLDKLMQDLLSQRADHIAMTGDLVNIALPEEFRRARAWLETIGPPDLITVIPGNHDAYVPFIRDKGFWRWEPYMLGNESGRAYGAPKPRRFPFVRIYGEIALVCLSTAMPTPPFMASGRLGRAQVKRLGTALQKLGDEGFCRVVLVHHPPMPGTTNMGWLRNLHDASRLRRRFLQYGAELVLHGHDHRAMIAQLQRGEDQIPIVGVPSASTATETPGKQAAYNLYSISKENGRWRIGMRSRVVHADRDTEEFDQDLLV